jgi:SAM-dependent methyltransferase
MDYFRFYEYPTFLSALDLSKGVSVLDLGCGRGLFPLFCAKKFREVSYTTLDIDPSAIAWQRAMEKKLGGLPNLTITEGDSTQIGFPDNSFDRVANLGSIEHIPGDGDIRTAEEMGRVCKPGGKLVFSIPYGPKGEELATTDHWDGFERRYDDRMLQDRIIGPSGCRVATLEYFGEPDFPFADFWYPLPFFVKLPFRHLMPLASTVWLKTLPESQKGKACGVRLVLEK